MKLLHENKYGIKIVRRDFTNRSEVKVRDFDDRPIMTYRFNNAPTYEHPMLSWANLDCCGGWLFDNGYLATAVQNGLKPVADVCLQATQRIQIAPDRDDIDVCYSPAKHSSYFHNALVALKQPLSELFDVYEVADAYMRQDVNLDTYRLRPYMSVPLNELFRDEFWVNPSTREELVITGLGLGYPIESTASLILNR